MPGPPSHSEAFVDFDALKEIVQRNAGPQVSITWGTDPQFQQGFGGLDAAGNALPGMPVSGPATDPLTSGSAASITLDIAVIHPRGVDDTRREYDADSDAIVMTQCGLREFSLTMRVETEAYPAAMTICERMRGRWLRVSTSQALEDIRCAIRQVGDTRGGQRKWGRKYIDTATLEVMLTYAYQETDDVGETTPVGNYIGSVVPLTFTPED